MFRTASSQTIEDRSKHTKKCTAASTRNQSWIVRQHFFSSLLHLYASIQVRHNFLCFSPFRPFPASAILSNFEPAHSHVQEAPQAIMAGLCLTVISPPSQHLTFFNPCPRPCHAHKCSTCHTIQTSLTLTRIMEFTNKLRQSAPGFGTGESVSCCVRRMTCHLNKPKHRARPLAIG